MEVGKRRLDRGVAWEATSNKVSDLKKENARLKEMNVPELVLRYDIVKKLRYVRLTHQHQKYISYGQVYGTTTKRTTTDKSTTFLEGA